MTRFEKIQGTDSPLFSEAREIYEASFPLEEQRSQSLQEQAWNDPGYEFLAIVRDGGIIGLLGVWHLHDCVFVEHLALSPAARGKGTGSAMLAEYLESLKGQLVILEIDLPEDDISRRRVEFYRRLGFHLTDHEHFQMPFRKGYNPLPLRIMSYPRAIDEEEYARFKEQYMARVMNFMLD